MNVEQLQALDFSILYWIQAHLRCPLLDAMMPRLTLLGEMGIFTPRERRCAYISSQYLCINSIRKSNIG